MLPWGPRAGRVAGVARRTGEITGMFNTPDGWVPLGKASESEASAQGRLTGRGEGWESAVGPTGAGCSRPSKAAVPPRSFPVSRPLPRPGAASGQELRPPEAAPGLRPLLGPLLSRPLLTSASSLGY